MGISPSQNLGGKNLWAGLQSYNPKILSTPVGPISADGKRLWCERELGLSGSEVIIAGNKGIDTNHTIILIDDKTKSIKEVEAVGGIGILHRPGGTLKTLETLREIIDTYTDE